MYPDVAAGNDFVALLAAPATGRDAEEMVFMPWFAALEAVFDAVEAVFVRVLVPVFDVLDTVFFAPPAVAEILGVLCAEEEGALTAVFLTRPSCVAVESIMYSPTALMRLPTGKGSVGIKRERGAVRSGDHCQRP